MSRRPIAFVLASANHGTMIVNRNDYVHISEGVGYGVGYQILQNSCFDPEEVGFAAALLKCRRKHFGDGVFAIDGGANIGVHTLEWAKTMYGWGTVLAFEAQERVYYALAGNIAINNCFNASVKHAALGETSGSLSIPQPNYLKSASFGSLELKQRANTEQIGQAISYAQQDCAPVDMVHLDSFDFARVDFIKLDIEGMEIEVLKGATQLIKKHRPIMTIEILKTNSETLTLMLTELGYKIFPIGINILAIHESDPSLDNIKQSEGSLSLVL